MSRCHCSASFWLAGIAGLLVAQAASAKILDVRVLVDVSGSMKHTDPQNLRVPSLRLLLELLPSGARAGVWTFGRYVNMQVPLAAVNPAWKRAGLGNLDQVHSRGLFTDIEAALRRATADWRQPDDRFERSVVLLTDGVVDTPGGEDASRKSRARLLGETIRGLRDAGARVHAIALSEDADRELLERLALASGGAFEMVERAEELQRTFLRMFERATRADAVPLEDDRFVVDSSIDELTVVVFRRSDRPARLEGPNGILLSSTEPVPGVRWRTDTGFDLVTVDAPTPGEWRIDGDVDPDNRVLVVTNMRLTVEDLPAILTPWRARTVRAELRDGGTVITRRSFLEAVKLDLEIVSIGSPADPWRAQMRDDGTEPVDVAHDGSHVATVPAALAEGSYDVHVRADGGTFRRERRQRFEVRWPVTAVLTSSTSEHSIEIAAHPDRMDAGSLRVRAQLRGASDGEGVRELPFDEIGGAHVATYRPREPGDQVLWISVTGTSADAEPFELALAPITLSGATAPRPEAPPVERATAGAPLPSPPDAVAPDADPPPSAAPPDWPWIGIVVTIANLFAAGLVLSAVLWRQRFRRAELARVLSRA